MRKISPGLRSHMRQLDHFEINRKSSVKTMRLGNPNRIETMNENKGEVLIGGLVVVVATAFTIYVMQVAGISTGSSIYTINAAFRSAQGVNVGTDVRLAGVKIGTVTAVSLDGETYKAQSTLAIDQDILIPDDSALVVASEGLFGGNFVEVVPGASVDYLVAGDEIFDTQGSISLIQLMMRVFSGGDDK